MQTIQFTVNITFADSITGDDEQIKEITNKIANALKHECDSGNGIAPDSSDTFTSEIQVIPQILVEESVLIKF